MPIRIAIVQDTHGQWYVRRLASSTHDGGQDVMNYVCDKHLAGPYAKAIDAAHWVTDNIHEGE